MWTAGNDLKGASQQTQVLGGQVEQKEPAAQWKDRVRWEVRADHTWNKRRRLRSVSQSARDAQSVWDLGNWGSAMQGVR